MSYDIFGQDLNALVERVNGLLQYETSVNYQNPIVHKPDMSHINNDLEGYNLEYAYLISGGTYNKSSYNRCKLIPKEGVRLCGVLYDCKVYVNNVDTGETIKTLAVVGNGTSSAVGLTALYDVHETGATSQQGGRALDTDNNGRNVYNVGGVAQNWRTIPFETIGEAYTNIETTSDTVINGLVDSLTPNDANEIKAVFMGVKNGVSHPFVGATTSTTRFVNNLWFVDKKQHACAYTITKYPFPIFESDKIPQIVNYLNTGDDTGSIDPLDTNPKKKKVEDFRSNFKMFISKDPRENNSTKFTVYAYNQDYINNGRDMGDPYYLDLYELVNGQRALIDRCVGDYYPVGTITRNKFSDATYSYAIQFAFTDEDSENTSRWWTIFIGEDDNSQLGVKIVVVNDGPTYNMSQINANKSNIVDGIKYTASTGETLEIYYRGAKITDIADDGYTDEEDTEDDETGSDVNIVTGSGYATYLISESQFNTINQKMWSTDWTNVFKSSSIDPIKCVISCKSIPFVAPGKSSGDITIANMNTGVHANTVNPIKSFYVGAHLMPSYNGDFSDLTMLKVHLYLPYIGWVDLPATEVISRVAYPNYGLTARPKILNFKYIVDFIDGACRCIVSVNNTERWYFDGNCGVDIPVTSDNHTGAVSTAVRNGLGATLSLASAVGGAVSGNGMMVATGAVGTIQNGLGSIPVYSYNASASPSGYINASMNTHIMIIIERPNIQRPEGYAHSVGLPCMRRLPLGSLSGFTKCVDVDTTGINGTPNEIAHIKSALESGVYL